MVFMMSDMGVSENVVSTPKNPMVLLIIIPTKNGYFIGGLDPIFRHTHIETYWKIIETRNFMAGYWMLLVPYANCHLVLG